MAKLIKCRDCGQSLSKKAKTCPNCGAPNKAGGFGWGSVIILSVIVGGGLTAVTQQGGSYAPSNSQTTRPSKVSEEAKEAIWIEKGKDAVRAALKDPDSAQFRNVYFKRGKDGIPVACGEVNSKNSLGGYGGYQKFVSAGKPELTYLEERVSDFANVWKNFCKT